MKRMKIRPSESVWDELNEFLFDNKKVLFENNSHIIGLFIIAVGFIGVVFICLLRFCL
jgi:hypothetical protein